MRDEKNSIRDAIETIEPSDAAKERMFENIQRKAERSEAIEQPKTAKILRMNRVMKWALPIAACLVLVVTMAFALPQLFASGTKLAENYDAAPMDPAEMANPWVTVKDSESLKENTGITIDAPAAADEIAYSSLGDEIADVTFTVEGHEYTLRASKSRDDFSELYGKTEKESTIASDNGTADLKVLSEGDEIYLKITWSDGDTVYILTNTDGASEEAFLEVYNSFNP